MKKAPPDGATRDWPECPLVDLQLLGVIARTHSDLQVLRASHRDLRLAVLQLAEDHLRLTEEEQRALAALPGGT
jgi:hypothetical protein